MNAIRELLISTGLALVSAGFLSTATPAQGQMIERSVFPGQCSPRGPANRMVEAAEEQCEPLSAAVTSAIVPTISKGNPGKTDTKTGAGRNPGTPSTGGGGPGAGDLGHGNVGDPGTGGVIRTTAVAATPARAVVIRVIRVTAVAATPARRG